MTYRRVIPIEFCHCDPAGIVFYPRYFEMINSVIENFFLEELDYSFARVVAGGCGVPTVHAEVDFRAPSRLGDRVEWRLEIAELGRSSVRFRLAAEDRLSAEMVLVWLGPGFRPAPWPDELRTRLEARYEPA